MTTNSQDRTTPCSPKIKICGLTRVADVEAAAAAGADMLGFVFDRGPCKIDPALGAELLSCARASGAGTCCVAVVGTLAGPQLQAIRTLGFDAVQMRASAYRPEDDNHPWALPAFFDDGGLVERVEAFRRQHRPRFDHLDPLDGLDQGERTSSVDGLRGLINVDGRGGGGTGTLADWQAARALADSGPLMLAGGLTADNVADAIAQVQPDAVDVSSGVEQDPGRKDTARIRAFVAAVRASRET